MGRRLVKSVLQRAWDLQEPRRAGIEQLSRWLGSPRVNVRLRALLAMRRQFSGGQPKAYLRMAKLLLWDRSENVRWPAAIVIGLFIDTDPDEVWRVLCEHQRRDNTDAVAMFGCVLLEDLLWAHFDRYWDRVVEHSLQEGSAMGKWATIIHQGSITNRQWKKVQRLEARLKQIAARS